MHITPREYLLAPAFDARAAPWTDLSRVHGAGREHHPIPGRQFDRPPICLQREGDRAVNAIQDLLVPMAVRRVPISW